MKKHLLSGWKCAWGVAWILVFSLLGLTVAEIAEFEGVVQFFGDDLTFTWDPPDDAHHYRIHLTTCDYGDPDLAEASSILYSEDPEILVESTPGLGYSIQVQALSAAGSASAPSTSSPVYLCLGQSGSDGTSQDMLGYLPRQTALGANYPNPFNSQTTIPYSIAPEAGNRVAVSMTIYNTLGREVRRLVDETKIPGQYRASWNGLNDQGIPVSAGTYICLLQAGEFSNTRMLVYMK